MSLPLCIIATTELNELRLSRVTRRFHFLSTVSFRVCIIFFSHSTVFPVVSEWNSKSRCFQKCNCRKVRRFHPFARYNGVLLFQRANGYGSQVITWASRVTRKGRLIGEIHWSSSVETNVEQNTYFRLNSTRTRGTILNVCNGPRIILSQNGRVNQSSPILIR